ncbi:hypothetical protein ACFPK5_00395 [Streptomyces beijiangensis]|uniref:hypothetical protein n=1 Tax=Streptomyces beijiangensis TaxID=163361 RepID=UPI0031DA985B
MIHPIRTVRSLWEKASRGAVAGWNRALGIVGVISDIKATISNRRATRAENKQLATTARTVALTKARTGCTHLPPCPPATAQDRTKAAEVYADDSFVYLCNGIVLSIKTPNSPFGLTIPTPAKETTL